MCAPKVLVALVVIRVPGSLRPGARGRARRVKQVRRGEQGVKIRLATPADVDAIKRTADECRAELGFHTRQSFLECVEKHELLVAVLNGQPAGFLRYHQTRAGHTTLREVATCQIFRGRGIGRALVKRLIAEARNTNSPLIRLSCPVELPANEFYRSLGFRRTHRRSKPGKSRPLYQWELSLRAGAASRICRLADKCCKRSAKSHSAVGKRRSL